MLEPACLKQMPKSAMYKLLLKFKPERCPTCQEHWDPCRDFCKKIRDVCPPYYRVTSVSMFHSIPSREKYAEMVKSCVHFCKTYF